MVARERTTYLENPQPAFPDLRAQDSTRVRQYMKFGRT